MTRVLAAMILVLAFAGCSSTIGDDRDNEPYLSDPVVTSSPVPSVDPLAEQYLARAAELGKYLSEDRDLAVTLAQTFCANLDQFYMADPMQAIPTLLENSIGRDRAAIEVYCPAYLPALAAAETGFRDGTYRVSSTPALGVIAPGVYRTAAAPKDCYWERVAGDGSIIANDFVSFAPDGIVLEVSEGEGLVVRGCGNWLKQ